jgi:hypothetical protein
MSAGRAGRRLTLALALALAATGGRARAGDPPALLLLAGSPSPDVAGALTSELGRRGSRVLVAAPVAAPEASAERVQAAALVGQVEASLRRAEELFYGVKLQAASALVSEELGRSSLALAFAGRFDLLRALHLWRGICAIKLGHRDAARTAFHASAALDDRPPDPTRFPPAIGAAYASAARELAARAKGKLTVAVTPADAELVVDGRPATGPTIELVQGEHWLEARALGYARAVRQVSVSDREQRLELRLGAASQAQLQEELHRRQERSGLDATSPAVAAALGRLQGASEALVVRERSAGAQLELELVRIRCSDGQRLERHVERVAPAERALVVRRALLRLWPVATPVTAPAARQTPVYKRWWFWALIGGGVAIAGGATAAGIVLSRGGEVSYVARVAAPITGR